MVHTITLGVIKGLYKDYASEEERSAGITKDYTGVTGHVGNNQAEGI